MPLQGTVFNIQRFSTHDGPGIRTTVFLKGCPLRCLWCANPESQVLAPQLMTRDIKCTGCGACVEACSRGAIVLSVDHGRIIHRDQCDLCFECVDACLYKALSVAGELKTPESVMETVKRDEVFYRNSGGGVTFSGGEPLVQHDFLYEVLAACRQEGFHTALDTTGHAPPRVLEKILPLADLALFDIKHLDPAQHKILTGVDNKLILENARLAANITRTWFRLPLMGGVNDSEEEISRVAAMAREWGVEKISLLPFHQGGEPKWAQVGLKSPGFVGHTPDDEHVERLAQIIRDNGIVAGIRS
ncbi:MAG: glycyl-radical enzyme activating protein [Desulfatibacillum sp.]|nr:glycyl-radical enzyme activating protein [Desulfatibacillum sp.]